VPIGEQGAPGQVRTLDVVDPAAERLRLSGDLSSGTTPVPAKSAPEAAGATPHVGSARRARGADVLPEGGALGAPGAALFPLAVDGTIGKRMVRCRAAGGLLRASGADHAGDAWSDNKDNAGHQLRSTGEETGRGRGRKLAHGRLTCSGQGVQWHAPETPPHPADRHGVRRRRLSSAWRRRRGAPTRRPALTPSCVT
jgi:hypothetical protein